MRRLGLVPWLGVWLVLSALQIGALVLMFPSGTAATGMLSPPVVLVAVLVLQLLKAPATVGRLMDLGRPLDDAVLLMVPVVSLGLTMSLLKGTPTDKKRDRELRRWQGRTLAPAAMLQGLRALLGAPLVTLPALALTGAAAAGIEGVLMPWFRGYTARQSLANGALGPASDGQILAYQGLLGAIVVLGLWLVLQLFNRKKASRASWLPTLLIAPIALVAVAFWPTFAELLGPDQAPPGFFMAGVALAWWIVGGGLLATLFIALGHDRREHGSVQVGRALAVWRPRFLGALAVHGGTVTVIFVGLQALWIPGLVYALMMAFTVHIALLDPQHKPFSGSSRLTRGWWRPVFNVLALGVVPGLALQIGAILAVDVLMVQLGGSSPFVDEQGVYSVGRMLAGWATSQAMPASVPLPPLGIALGASLNALMLGASSAGLVWTYRERAAQKAGKKQAAGKPVADGS